MKRLISILAIFVIIINGCDSLEPDDLKNVSDIDITVVNLPVLPDTMSYAGYLVMGSEKAQSFLLVAKLELDASGNSNIKLPQSFSNLQSTRQLIVSIEDNSKIDSTKIKGLPILSGNFEANFASLSLDGIIKDISTGEGVYNLATPTNGVGNDEKSGVWLVDSLSSASGPLKGLNIEKAPAGWVYKTWCKIGGTLLDMGSFDNPGSPDNSCFYCDSLPGYPFPGEDFLTNAPAGLTFPTDLSGAKLMITLEPLSSSTTDTQFGIILFEADIPADAQSGITYPLTNKSGSYPNGTAAIIVK